MVDFATLTCYFGAASVEGISLLPTLLFIIGAYSLYALWALWSRCRKRRLCNSEPPVAPRLLQTGGAVILVCILGLAVRFFSPPAAATHRLSGVLGAAEAGLTAARAEPMPEKPPVPVAGPEGHPAYALLHPETPPILMPEKPAASGHSPRKPKMKRPAGRKSQRAGIGSKTTAKEKPEVIDRAKKAKSKKATKPASMQQAYSPLRW